MSKKPEGLSVCGCCGQVFDCYGNCEDRDFLQSQRIEELEEELSTERLRAGFQEERAENAEKRIAELEATRVPDDLLEQLVGCAKSCCAMSSVGTKGPSGKVARKAQAILDKRREGR